MSSNLPADERFLVNTLPKIIYGIIYILLLISIIIVIISYYQYNKQLVDPNLIGVWLIGITVFLMFCLGINHIYKGLLTITWASFVIGIITAILYYVNINSSDRTLYWMMNGAFIVYTLSIAGSYGKHYYA